MLTPTSLMGGGGGSLAHVLQHAGREVEEEEEKEFLAYSYVEQPGNINKTADQVLVLNIFVFYPRESGVDTLAVRSRLMHKMHVKINVTSISFWPFFLLFGNITNSSTALTLVFFFFFLLLLPFLTVSVPGLQISRISSSYLPFKFTNLRLRLMVFLLYPTTPTFKWE